MWCHSVLHTRHYHTHWIVYVVWCGPQTNCLLRARVAPFVLRLSLPSNKKERGEESNHQHQVCVDAKLLDSVLSVVVVGRIISANKREGVVVEIVFGTAEKHASVSPCVVWSHSVCVLLGMAE